MQSLCSSYKKTWLILVFHAVSPPDISMTIVLFNHKPIPIRKIYIYVGYMLPLSKSFKIM